MRRVLLRLWNDDMGALLSFELRKDFCTQSYEGGIGMQTVVRLWRDDSGALLSFEWILLASILVLAMVVGLKSVQQAVLNEFEDLANAIGNINSSYQYRGAQGCCASVGGSEFNDGARMYDVDSCELQRIISRAGGSCVE